MSMFYHEDCGDSCECGKRCMCCCRCEVYEQREKREREEYLSKMELQEPGYRERLKAEERRCELIAEKERLWKGLKTKYRVAKEIEE